MSCWRAPMAMRMPISRVRSVTDTSMMFMIPMPPTSSDTRRDGAEQQRHHLRRLRLHVGRGAHVADHEVVVLPFLDAMPLAQQLRHVFLGAAMYCSPAAFTIIIRTLFGNWLPKTLRCAVVSGTSTVSS
jgi:hypothetical protein